MRIRRIARRTYVFAPAEDAGLQGCQRSGNVLSRVGQLDVELLDSSETRSHVFRAFVEDSEHPGAAGSSQEDELPSLG